MKKFSQKLPLYLKILYLFSTQFTHVLIRICKKFFSIKFTRSLKWFPENCVCRTELPKEKEKLRMGTHAITKKTHKTENHPSSVDSNRETNKFSQKLPPYLKTLYLFSTQFTHSRRIQIQSTQKATAFISSFKKSHNKNTINSHTERAKKTYRTTSRRL